MIALTINSQLKFQSFCMQILDAGKKKIIIILFYRDQFYNISNVIIMYYTENNLKIQSIKNR